MSDNGQDDVSADIAAAFESASNTIPMDRGGSEPAHGKDSVPINGAAQDAVPAPGNEPTRYDQRARDKTGKFIEQDKAAKSAAPSEAAEAKPAPTDAKAPIDPGQQAKTPVAPARWTAAEKAEFAQLPPAIQATVSRREVEREAAFTRRQQQIASQAQMYGELDRLLQPRAQQFQMMGMTPTAAVQQLLALSDFANRDPAGFIQHIAKQNNIDLGNLSKPAEEQYIDPAVKALQAELSQIRQHLQGSHQQQQASQQQQMLHAVTTFAQETDANGNLVHPLLAEEDTPAAKAIMDEMLMRVPALRAGNPHLSPRDILSKAYEAATWAAGETREQNIERMVQERLAKAQTEAQAKARAAIAPAVSPRSGNAAGSFQRAPADDPETDLRRAFG